MAGSEKGSVFFALLGNGILTILKFIAFVVSGSGAMLSESIHSFADTSNQGLLFFGIQRSQRPADDRFHFGYGADRFFYALLSAVGIFVLGCGVTIYHGIEGLLDPHPIEITWLPFAVLGISLVVEGLVLYGAIREVNRKRGELSLMQYIKTSSDPTLIAVLFEDAVAVLGVIVAVLGIWLTHITGSHIYDAMSSIIIGLLLGAVALWLAYRNRQLLLGPAIPKNSQQEVVAYLESQPSVASVRLVRTRVTAANRFSLIAEIDYEGRFFGAQQSDWIAKNHEQFAEDGQRSEYASRFGDRVMEALGDEVDRLEAEIAKRFPHFQHIALESD